MASIENLLPPPRLIAHNTFIDKTPVYIESQQITSRTTAEITEEESRQNRSYLSRKFSQSITSVSALIEENPTSNKSSEENPNRKTKVETTETTTASEQNQKVNFLRSEISRLREEMLTKINTLENEMSTRVEHRSDLYYQRRPYEEKSTQTIQAGEKVSQGGPSDDLEYRLLQAIDAKFQNFRDDIFEKFETYFAAGSNASRQRDGRYEPRQTQSPQQQKLSASRNALWKLNNAVNDDREGSGDTEQQRQRRSTDVSIMTREGGSGPSYEFDSKTVVTQPRTLDYNNDHIPSTTVYEPTTYSQRRKSPIPPSSLRHHYQHASPEYPPLCSSTASQISSSAPTPHTSSRQINVSTGVSEESNAHQHQSRFLSSTPPHFYDSYQQQRQQDRPHQASSSSSLFQQRTTTATATIAAANSAEDRNNQYTQTAREEFSRHLVDQFFSYDDLADANVRGVKGKRLLDPNKIQKIRDTVFRTYPLRSNENEEYFWKFICDKINAKCRGVTRTLKRKSAIWEMQPCGHGDTSLVKKETSFNEQSNMLPAFKYCKQTYNLKRYSFVAPSSSADNHRNFSRLPSSSDSETSSVDLVPTAPVPTDGRSWSLLQKRRDETRAEGDPLVDSSSHNTTQQSNTTSLSSSISCFASVSTRRNNNQDLSSANREATGSRSSSAPVMRSSFMINSSTMADEAVKAMKEEEDDEDDIEIKVIDEEEDDVSISDDISMGICDDYDRFPNYDKTRPPTIVPPETSMSVSSPPALLSSSSSQSALELCDKLAEKYMESLTNTAQQQEEGNDASSAEMTIAEKKKRVQSNREEFTRTLIEAMFTRSTLAHSNVTGARGKFMLDPVKIAKVRDTVFLKFPADGEDEEETVWKILTTKINTKCRGVKRLMKRKGISAECITNRYQGVIDNINNKSSTCASSTLDNIHIKKTSSSQIIDVINKMDNSQHSPPGTISSSASSASSASANSLSPMMMGSCSVDSL